MKLSKDDIILLKSRMVHDIQRIEKQAEKQPENVIVQGFYSEAVRRRQQIIFKLNSKLDAYSQPTQSKNQKGTINRSESEGT